MTIPETGPTNEEPDSLEGVLGLALQRRADRPVPLHQGCGILGTGLAAPVPSEASEWGEAARWSGKAAAAAACFGRQPLDPDPARHREARMPSQTLSRPEAQEPRDSAHRCSQHRHAPPASSA